MRKKINLEASGYILIVALMLAACNPVKSVLGDAEKFEQVAKEVVRRGYCVNDTVTVTKVRDSIVEKPVEVVKVVNVPCKDFDTTINKNRIAVRSGVLYFTPKPDSIVYRETVKENNIRDRKLENILKRDKDSLSTVISNRDAEIVQLKAGKVKDGEKIKSLESELSKIGFKNKLKIGGILLLCGIIVFRKPLIRLIGL